MKYEKWQLLQQAVMDFSMGYISKLAQPSITATWPASVEYKTSASKSVQQAWQLGNIITDAAIIRPYDETKAEKYRQWQIANKVEIDFSKGHVSKLLKSEVEMYSPGIEEIYQEQLREVKAARNNMSMKKAA